MYKRIYYKTQFHIKFFNLNTLQKIRCCWCREIKESLKRLASIYTSPQWVHFIVYATNTQVDSQLYLESSQHTNHIIRYEVPVSVCILWFRICLHEYSYSISAYACKLITTAAWKSTQQQHIHSATLSQYQTKVFSE